MGTRKRRNKSFVCYSIFISSYFSLQLSSYNFLSTDSVHPFGITKVLISQSEESIAQNGEIDQTTHIDSSSEEPYFVRDELHCVLQTPPLELFESHLTANNRVMQASCTLTENFTATQICSSWVSNVTFDMQ